MKVSAVVISHGHADELAVSLPVLAPQVDELLVIANVPDSLPPELPPAARVLRNDRPLSFAANANLGAARDCLRQYSPSLAAACHSGRVFCDAYSPDGEPVVRALDESGRIVFAGAANGSGYRLAPAIAAQATDLLHLTRSEGATGDHQYV